MIDKIADWEMQHNDASETSARTYAEALMAKLKTELAGEA